ncbi:DivIVA domain-containing protein [Nocardia sp. NPDC051832]|uniref:DivIVA domain-containing protein n=1 Tax=Nocardia sp. NPDC051832 TaxID=3155673 RepID=UPI00342D4CAD
MLTLLLYVLIVGLVAAVLFLLASAVFGRGEELGPLPEGTTATVLPAEGITGADVRSLRFQQVVRGYKAGEVDWALTRLAARIDELQVELARARGYASPHHTATNNHQPEARPRLEKSRGAPVFEGPPTSPSGPAPERHTDGYPAAPPPRDQQ